MSKAHIVRNRWELELRWHEGRWLIAGGAIVSTGPWSQPGDVRDGRGHVGS